MGQYVTVLECSNDSSLKRDSARNTGKPLKPYSVLCGGSGAIISITSGS